MSGVWRESIRGSARRRESTPLRRSHTSGTSPRRARTTANSNSPATPRDGDIHCRLRLNPDRRPASSSERPAAGSRPTASYPISFVSLPRRFHSALRRLATSCLLPFHITTISAAHVVAEGRFRLVHTWRIEPLLRTQIPTYLHYTCAKFVVTWLEMYNGKIGARKTFGQYLSNESYSCQSCLAIPYRPYNL